MINSRELHMAIKHGQTIEECAARQRMSVEELQRQIDKSTKNKKVRNFYQRGFESNEKKVGKARGLKDTNNCSDDNPEFILPISAYHVTIPSQINDVLTSAVKNAKMRTDPIYNRSSSATKSSKKKNEGNSDSEPVTSFNSTTKKKDKDLDKNTEKEVENIKPQKSCEEMINEAEEEIKKISKKIFDSEATLKSISSSRLSLSEDFISLKDEYLKHRKEIETLINKMVNLSNNLTHLDEKAQKTRDEKASLVSKRTELTDKVSKLKTMEILIGGVDDDYKVDGVDLSNSNKDEVKKIAIDLFVGRYENQNLIDVLTRKELEIVANLILFVRKDFHVNYVVVADNESLERLCNNLLNAEVKKRNKNN